MIENEKKAFRSKKSGRVYTIEKILDRGVLILKSEDGLSSALTTEETMEFYFVKEPRRNTETYPSS